MSKTPQIFADTLPPVLRRACSCMSGDGGFPAWLDAKFGAGKWVHGEYLPEGFERNITNRELGDLAVEYGYGRLQAAFATAPELPLQQQAPNDAP